MASILSHAIISNATETVNSYITTVNGLNDELAGIISTLTTANFIGDASDGYKYFYTEKVLPAITQNLVDPSASLTASIKNMLESIQTQLLDTIDTQLGENNQNPGSEG